MKPFNPNLPVMTRGGDRAEILAVLPPEKATYYGETIVALVTDEDGARDIHCYTADGKFNPDLRHEGQMDLINTPTSVLVNRLREAARS